MTGILCLRHPSSGRATRVFNICVRRRPIVLIRRDGVAVNIIGSTTLDGIPLVPTLILVGWGILTMQSFSQQRLIASWDDGVDAQVSGIPMARTLVIRGSFSPVTSADFDDREKVVNEVVYPEVVFEAPLEQVASAINMYARRVELRDSLGTENPEHHAN